MKENPVRFCIV